MAKFWAIYLNGFFNVLFTIIVKFPPTFGSIYSYNHPLRAIFMTIFVGGWQGEGMGAPLWPLIYVLHLFRNLLFIFKGPWKWFVMEWLATTGCPITRVHNTLPEKIKHAFTQPPQKEEGYAQTWVWSSKSVNLTTTKNNFQVSTRVNSSQ